MIVRFNYKLANLGGAEAAGHSGPFAPPIAQQPGVPEPPGTPAPPFPDPEIPPPIEEPPKPIPTPPADVPPPPQKAALRASTNDSSLE